VLGDGSVWLSGASFLDGLVFENRGVRSIVFERAGFGGQRTSFAGSTFTNPVADFSRATFGSDFTDFSTSSFPVRVSFEDCEFVGKSVSFNGVAFGQSNSELTVSFRGAQFNVADCSFAGAKFSEGMKGVDFQKAKFAERRTDFSSAYFGSNTSFEGPNFPSSTMFRDFRFYESVRFANSEFQSASFEGAYAKVEVYGNAVARIVFDHVGLSKTRFAGAELHKMRFLDVEWNRKGWTRRLYDEELWRRERASNTRSKNIERLEELAKLYRSLKNHYRDSGEYELVGYFHYDLMETRRFRTSYEGHWPIFETLYYWSSGYAESYKKAFLGLVFLIALSAGVYFVTGTPELGTGTCADSLKQIVASLAYSLQVASVGRLHYFPDVTFDHSAIWSVLTYSVETILGPIQIAFLILALRNRFRR